MNPEDKELERDILRGRKFTLADVIAQQGGTFLKGESPVPKLVQAMTEIKQFIALNLDDSSGALQAILQIIVEEDLARVSGYINTPIEALQDILEEFQENQALLHDLVQRVDVKWGEMFGERPHFQQPNQIPHPDDEYTHESVRQKLGEFLEKVRINCC
jgi:hypothetical protein